MKNPAPFLHTGYCNILRRFGVGGKKQNLRKSLMFRGFLRFDKSSCDPPGAVKLRRCIVSINELPTPMPVDSRIYHVYTSMFFTGLQFR